MESGVSFWNRQNIAIPENSGNSLHDPRVRFVVKSKMLRYVEGINPAVSTDYKVVGDAKCSNEEAFRI